jgi:parallel beta-helix repeat protein
MNAYFRRTILIGLLLGISCLFFAGSLFALTQQLNIEVNDVSADCEILSYGGSQDQEGTVSVSNDGNTLTLSGNTWKKVNLGEITITENTVLEFDFSSSSEGEVHGIGFNTDDSISYYTTFKLHGIHNWGLRDFDNYTAPQTRHYTIPVGEYFTGTFSSLVFAMDDDANATGESVFSNIRITNQPTQQVSIEVNDVSANCEILSYGGGQDKEGIVAVSDNGNTLTLTGNTWKKVNLGEITITENTVLEFDFSSSSEGEIHGIGFDTDNSISASSTFRLHGTQSWGQAFDNYTALETRHYTIPVGEFFAGNFNSLFFVMDDDATATGESVFSNIRITNQPTNVLYVDMATGDDRISYAENSSSTPWATLGRAVWGSTSLANPNSSQAARAGDTVIVRSGSYNVSEGTGERYLPVYNPVNSGEAGNPIVFKADGDVILSSSTNTRGEPLIGTCDRNYIVWDGFILDEMNINTKADTGPVTIWSSGNVTIQNLTVRGITSSWNDNHNAIRLERSHDVVIRNNTLYGNRNAGSNRNGSSIMLYYTNDIIIENNEISDSGGGIFVKGANGGPVTIRYNYIHGVDSEGIAIGVLGTETEQFGGQVYQNIIRDCTNGISFIGYNSYSPANVDVVNNTIYNCSNGGIFVKPSTNGYRDIVFINNIIVGNTNGIQGEDISDLSSMTFRYNLYHDNGVHARIAYTDYSFSGWQNTFAKDTEGSLLSDPMFSDTSDNTFTHTNINPVNDAGIDILNLRGQGTNAPINLGARVTGNEVIGVTNATD